MTDEDYRTALIRLDELRLMLRDELTYVRIAWDWDMMEASDDAVLGSLNRIIIQMGDAIPDSIKRTRPVVQRAWEVSGE